VPEPVPVANRSGTTLVTNAGCNGKFLGVVDLDVKDGKVRERRYRLLPVFSDLLEPDAEMDTLIRRARAPYEEKLSEKLALTEELLYRRGNFAGTFDQLILDALMEDKGAEIAFSPGFRFGASLLPGTTVTFEHVMEQTAITYPQVVVNALTGAAIKGLLEDVCDNVFNPDPYQQQGGDMVRVGGMRYRCEPGQKIGSRISGMTLNGKPLDAGKTYKVASWAPVAEGVSGEPVWDVVARHLRARKIIRSVTPNRPALIGVKGNPGQF
jgi:sulfur-oxidizing protein SoxB